MTEVNEQEHKNHAALDRTAEERKAVRKKKRPSAVRPEQIRWDPNAVFRENEYYTRIAGKYRVCKYITGALALVFTVVMLTAFSSDITSENFQYLIKDLDITGLTSAGDFATIVFNGGANSKFGIYRGELAVVDTGLTGLYRSSGSLSFSKSNIFYSPELLISDKYMLVYDAGNTTRAYSVYNSFSELKHEKLDHPITGAALADNGSYVIVTRDGTYKGIALWYDSDFNLLTEIKKDKYIISAALSPDGSELLLASIYDEGGAVVTELMTVSVGADAPSAQITVKGDMPMSAQYMEDGRVTVLYTDRLSFCSADLTETTSISFESLLSVRAEIGEKLICVVNNNTLIGNDKTVSIYGTDGTELYRSRHAGELLRIRSFRDHAYLLFEDRVVRIDSTDGSESTVSTEPNAIDLVFTSSGLPVVCYAGSAVPVTFEEQPADGTD